MSHDISDMNKRRWSGKLAGHQYRKARDLFPPERVIIDLLARRIANKRILDIGTGTGRTTEALIAVSPHYIGIDYSPEMIRRARERNPAVDFRCMDARDLSQFADGSFDLVWFSFNGIDYVSHEDRLCILGEIHRVISDRGYFCFSSHNRDFHGLGLDGSSRPVWLSANPVKLAFRYAKYAWSYFNTRKLSHYQSRNETYAMINDPELNYGLLTYYISLPKQVEQLRIAGFGKVRAFGLDGAPIEDVTYSDGYMIHYLSEKT